MTPLIWLGVLAAGGVGACLRFVVDAAVARRLTAAFPWGTTVVNLSGALVLGLLSGLVLAPGVSLVLGTGAVGSYTTFSTWVLESQRLAEERQSRSAAVNLVLPALLGLGCAALGRWIAGW